MLYVTQSQLVLLKIESWSGSKWIIDQMTYNFTIFFNSLFNSEDLSLNNLRQKMSVRENLSRHIGAPWPWCAQPISAQYFSRPRAHWLLGSQSARCLVQVLVTMVTPLDPTTVGSEFWSEARIGSFSNFKILKIHYLKFKIPTAMGLSLYFF